MGDLVKNLVIWTVIAVVLMSLFSGISGRNTASDEYNYSEFMQQVQTAASESSAAFQFGVGTGLCFYCCLARR